MSQSDPANTEATTHVVKRNIDTIAQLEREYLQERSIAERFGHLIAQSSGTLTFAVINTLAFALWVLLNIGIIPGIQPFDPYPFSLLTMLVSLEAILLSIFILMSQNSMRGREEQRAHLDLQLSLLIEQEITEMFQIQQQAFKRLGALDETESQATEQLRETKHVQTLAAEVEKKIPHA